MHHRYVKSPTGTWSAISVVEARDFQQFDDQLYKSINGSDGGVWEPSKPIVIGGDGLTLGTFLKLQTAMSYSRVVPLSDIHAEPTLQEGGVAPTSAPRSIISSLQYDYSGIGTQVLFSNTKIFIPLDDYLHDGATLSNIRLNFNVGKIHAAVPQFLPTIRVIRTLGNMSAALSHLSTLGTQDIADPDDGPDWWRDGAAQTFDYVCDQNNVIDRANYIYFAYINEETGSNAFSTNVALGIGNFYNSLRLDFTNVTDLKFP